MVLTKQGDKSIKDHRLFFSTSSWGLEIDRFCQLAAVTAFAGFLPESEEMNLEWSKQLIAEYVLLWKKIENVWRRVTLGKKQEKTELTKIE